VRTARYRCVRCSSSSPPPDRTTSSCARTTSTILRPTGDSRRSRRRLAISSGAPDGAQPSSSSTAPWSSTSRLSGGRRGRVLDLTFMEYELLRFLAAVRQVFTARHCSAGSGATSTTACPHCRRPRPAATAKLGEEHAHLIETVRSVGYRFGHGTGHPDAEPIGHRVTRDVGPDLDLDQARRRRPPRHQRPGRRDAESAT